MIDDKSDYSENGSLEKPKQLQQEYWVIVYYTLLISIASFLVSDVWRERGSILPIGADVTLEPADMPITSRLRMGGSRRWKARFGHVSRSCRMRQAMP